MEGQYLDDVAWCRERSIASASNRDERERLEGSEGGTYFVAKSATTTE